MIQFELSDHRNTHRLYVGKMPFGSAIGAELKSHEIKTAVVLLETLEYVKGFYSQHNIKRIIHFPIKDFSVPEDTKSVEKLVLRIHKALKKGNVFMHCMGGKGRTGTIAACLKISNDRTIQTPNEAILFTRKVIRDAIETKEQEEFIADYFSSVRPRKENTQHLHAQRPSPQLKQEDTKKEEEPRQLFASSEK